MKDIEQRIAIKLLVKQGKPGNEIRKVLREIYGQDAMGKATVYTWIKRFSEGRTNVEDNERTGRPMTRRTDNNIEKVGNIIRANPRQTIRNIGIKVCMEKESIRRVLVDDLCLRFLFSKWIPKELNEEQKIRRYHFCKELLNENDESFFNRIITGDEYWIYYYNSDSCNKVKIKTMLVCFFDKNGVIHHEFLPEGQEFNQNFYHDVLLRLIKQVKKTRPELSAKKLILYHGNSIPHTGLTVKKLCAEEQIIVLEYFTFWADLAPFDYFLVHRLKNMLKGTKFNSKQEIETKAAWILKLIPQTSGYLNSFEELRLRWKACVETNGEYYEITKISDETENSDVKEEPVDEQD